MQEISCLIIGILIGILFCIFLDKILQQILPHPNLQRKDKNIDNQHKFMRETIKSFTHSIIMFFYCTFTYNIFDLNWDYHQKNTTWDYLIVAYSIGVYSEILFQMFKNNARDKMLIIHHFFILIPKFHNFIFDGNISYIKILFVLGEITTLFKFIQKLSESYQNWNFLKNQITVIYEIAFVIDRQFVGTIYVFYFCQKKDLSFFYKFILLGLIYVSWIWCWMLNNKLIKLLNKKFQNFWLNQIHQILLYMRNNKTCQIYLHSFLVIAAVFPLFYYEHETWIKQFNKKINYY